MYYSLNNEIAIKLASIIHHNVSISMLLIQRTCSRLVDSWKKPGQLREGFQPGKVRWVGDKKA